ncbi:MAG: rhomboid family intramembrane serine protease [Pseudomonadales bacterium]
MDSSPSLVRSFMVGSFCVVLLWWIKLLEYISARDWHELGVWPRSIAGLIGVPFAPLIHGSFQHLISNTLAVWFLVTVLFYGYPRSAKKVLAIVWLLSGLGVWWLARESYHFGASGLTHGVFFFLLIAGFLRGDKRSVVLLMLAFFMYGTMIFTIFPGQPGVSWEYHFFGAVAGALAAFIFRHQDARLQPRHYSWQDEDEYIEDPVIGDQWRLPDKSPAQREHGLVNSSSFGGYEELESDDIHIDNGGKTTDN